jgi:hypothetical protein
LAADGVASGSIGRAVGCTTGTASKWRVRYARKWLAGLGETGKRGAAPKYTTEDEQAHPGVVGSAAARGLYIDLARRNGGLSLEDAVTSAVRVAGHPVQAARASAPAAGSTDRASVATASLTTLLTTTLASLLVLLAVLILIVLVHSFLQIVCEVLFECHQSTNPPTLDISYPFRIRTCKQIIISWQVY